jgi:hypothetical protein
MSDKNHNLNCPRAAELVSYLYDEIGKSEKAVFEKHLAKCRNCADELADFSFARFSVKDWRDAEFAHLKTPVIEIPFETKPLRETVSADSVSLLDNLRRIFSPSTIWTTSAAALAVFIGLFLTATNFFQPDLTAEKKNVNFEGGSVLSSAKPETQPKVAPLIEPEIVNSVVQSSDSSKKRNLTENLEIVQQNRPPENRKKSVVKASAHSPKIKNGRESGENIAASDVKKTNNQAQQIPVRINRPIPILNSFDEEEDNTLRLAEMFEEIDAGK